MTSRQKWKKWGLEKKCETAKLEEGIQWIFADGITDSIR